MSHEKEGRKEVRKRGGMEGSRRKGEQEREEENWNPIISILYET